MSVCDSCRATMDGGGFRVIDLRNSAEIEVCSAECLAVAAVGAKEMEMRPKHTNSAEVPRRRRWWA